MEFKDILALAKQGYKPADIKELLSIEIPKDEPGEPPQPDPTDDDHKDLKEPEGKEPPQPDPRDAEIEELKKALAAAQDLNKSKDLGNDPKDKTDEDVIADFVSDFF